MAEVITFDDLEGFDLSMEGDDVLVMKVNLSKKIGKTNKGFDKFAGTGSAKPVIAGEHRVKVIATVYG